MREYEYDWQEHQDDQRQQKDVKLNLAGMKTFWIDSPVMKGGDAVVQSSSHIFPYSLLENSLFASLVKRRTIWSNTTEAAAA